MLQIVADHVELEAARHVGDFEAQPENNTRLWEWATNGI
jgi:hypothetical protein